jgi:hypothetical protein
MAIRKLDPNAKFRLICELDDALISETSEELEALKTGKKDEDGNETLNPTRYQEYLDDLDESKLKMRDGAKPSYFHFRCLTNEEMGILQEKYFDYDVKEKRPKFKGSKTEYFIELFRLGVIGLEDDGQIAKVSANEVGYAVMVAVGSAVNIFTSLGKHLKK